MLERKTFTHATSIPHPVADSTRYESHTFVEFGTLVTFDAPVGPCALNTAGGNNDDGNQELVIRITSEQTT